MDSIPLYYLNTFSKCLSDPIQICSIHQVFYVCGSTYLPEHLANMKNKYVCKAQCFWCTWYRTSLTSSSVVFPESWPSKSSAGTLWEAKFDAWAVSCPSNTPYKYTSSWLKSLTLLLLNAFISLKTGLTNKESSLVMIFLLITLSFP